MNWLIRFCLLLQILHFIPLVWERWRTQEEVLHCFKRLSVRWLMPVLIRCSVKNNNEGNPLSER